MKRNLLLTFQGLIAAALLLSVANFASAQTTNMIINDFSTGSEGITPTSCGSGWGAGSILWDNSELYPGTTGSAYIDAGFSTSDNSQTPVNDYICFPPYDNWYWNGNGNVDLSQYSAVQFELLWDTVDSSMSIDQFNNPSSYLSGFAGSIPGLEIDSCVGSGVGAVIGTTNIPDAASNGWVTITLPISPSITPSAGDCGIFLHKWINNESNALAQASVTPSAFFWIANVQLIGTAAPPPPPTVKLPVKPTPGLNVTASTAGIYDRQQAGLVASNGVSWVGHATMANPVTYSFTIDGFPQNPATQFACEAYLIMSPNPAYYDLAIDYNEPNAVIISLQQGPGTTLMTFQYKTNEPASETLTTIGTVTNTGTALGTWSLTFTSDTNVIMTAPDGNTSSFLFTNAASFAEVKNPGCYLYLGMQANNNASLNDAVCYSKFSLTGVPAAVTDNFLTDATLNTNVWYHFMATGPAGVFVLPPGAENWLTWTLPAAGFQFQYATSLGGPWTVLKDTNDITLSGVGQVSQLITTNDIPAGAPAAFFDLANP